eukprot:5832468-Amphidinium_carterae.1
MHSSGFSVSLWLLRCQHCGIEGCVGAKLRPCQRLSRDGACDWCHSLNLCHPCSRLAATCTRRPPQRHPYTADVCANVKTVCNEWVKLVHGRLLRGWQVLQGTLQGVACSEQARHICVYQQLKYTASHRCRTRFSIIHTSSRRSLVRSLPHTLCRMLPKDTWHPPLKLVSCCAALSGLSSTWWEIYRA